MNTFGFSPATGLLDTSAYPSQPTTEGQARQQFMDLFNQLKTFLNTDVKNDLADKPSKTADFVNSLVASGGYQKLPNGLIIQWGQGSALNNTQTTFTFPIAFPNAMMFCTAIAESGTATSCVILGLSTSSLKTIQNSGVTATTHWFAIGY